jgi:hypothetical protein
VNLAAIRDGLKGVIDNVTDLRAFDVIPENDMPVPLAVVVPGDPYVSYQEAMQRGMAYVRFRVVLIATKGQVGQAKIDELLSSGTGLTGSLVDALEAERTWGGTVHDSVIETASDRGLADVNAVTYEKVDLVLRAQVGRQ